MNFRQFEQIIYRIEEDLDGAGYFVRLRLIDGRSVFGAISFSVPKDPLIDDKIICIERAADEDQLENHPHIYIPMSSIVAIEGPMMLWRDR